MMSRSGNTYAMANTFKLSKHTCTHGMERESQKLEAEGGWQRRAPRGTNTDSSVTAHRLPYLPKTNHPVHTNKHICFANKCTYIICQTVRDAALTFIAANCCAI